MEPLHITEFASKRYYEKIDQLPKVQQQQSPDEISALQGSSSKFILPIRQADQQGHEPTPRHGEHLRVDKEKEKEKRGILSRLRPSKNAPSAEAQPLRRPSFTATSVISSAGEISTPKRKSLQFDQLFLNLPSELQIQIISYLPLSDVLNLRLASRAWHGMVTLNEVPIVRYQLAHEVPAYAKRLYPIVDSTGYTLHYLCGLWHRLHVAAKLASRICDWSTEEIFLKKTKEQVASFAGQRERMYRRLIPLLFTIYHFFETYRKLHLQYIREHGYGIERTPYTFNPIEVQIMNMYDDRTLLKVHQVFPMVVASFRRRLRPPSYAGLLERTVRGYLREKPTDDVHTAVLVLGGLRQVLRFWEVKGYNTRVGAVDAWYNDVRSIKESPAKSVDTTTASKETSKPRRGIMGLGRKKSTSQTKDSAKSENAAGQSSGRGSLEQAAVERDCSVPSRGFVFHTSLAAGMPMDRLDQEQYQMLLHDLPLLRKLWLTSAEAMVLDRGIVRRAVDIKRNDQVMLDLIKEDGVIEEDIWWYGMATTESIRPPPMEAIEEDPIE